jgi:hypothetical protein
MTVWVLFDWLIDWLVLPLPQPLPLPLNADTWLPELTE